MVRLWSPSNKSTLATVESVMVFVVVGAVVVCVLVGCCGGGIGAGIARTGCGAGIAWTGCGAGFAWTSCGARGGGTVGLVRETVGSETVGFAEAGVLDLEFS